MNLPSTDSFGARGLSYYLNIIFNLLLVYSITGLVTGGAHLVNAEGPRLISAHSWHHAGLIAIALWLMLDTWPKIRAICVSKGWLIGPVSKPRLQLALIPEVFVLGLLIFLLSDFSTRGFVFYINRSTRAVTLYLGIIWLLFLLPRGRESKSLNFNFPPAILIGSQLIIAALFLKFAAGRLLFCDDHPSFLYRLQLLREHFPNIPLYDANWNAGHNAREFFATGVLNVFLLCAPFIYTFFDISGYHGAELYNYIFPYLYGFLVPWSSCAAARRLGVGRSEALLAALLSLAGTLSFYEWVLKYGTLGFSLSAGLTPLCVVMCAKFALSDKSPSWSFLLALLLVSFLVLAWTVSAVTLVPVTILALLFYRQTFAGDRRVKVVVFALLFALINGPWLKIFFEESKVLSFLSLSTLPGADPNEGETLAQGASGGAMPSTTSITTVAQVKKAATPAPLAKRAAKKLKLFRQSLARMNPMILLFFLPGLFLISSGREKLVLVFTICWLTLIAAVGDLLKPQLELLRLLIPATFVMCIPAAVGISYTIRRLREIGADELRRYSVRRVGAVIGLVAVLGSVAITPLVAGAVWVNRSDDKFGFAPPIVKNLSQAIREFGGEGRTFFLGFILHDLGSIDYQAQNGGHVAPLPAFSGKPMYASHFYHARWSTVDPIPSSYRRRGSEGIEEFLDLVNATAVVTFKREWADYCLKDPRYKQVYQEDRFRLFVRQTTHAGYFLKGTGEVLNRKEGFGLRAATGEVILKFRYYPKLKSDTPGVELFPVPAFTEELGGGRTEDVQFVGVRIPPQVLSANKVIGIGFY